MKTKIIFSAFLGMLILFCLDTHAQTNTFPSTGKVGIGTTTPNASSLLEIKSTTKGLLIPRLTQTQRNAIASPANGLMVYQTNTSPGFYYFDGKAWSSVAYWKRDSAGKLIFYNQGNVGIGTGMPIAKLQVTGGNSVQLGTGGYVVIGDTQTNNMAIDNNHIQSRHNGSANELYLNDAGGNTYAGSSSNSYYGLIGFSTNFGLYGYASSTEPGYEGDGVYGEGYYGIVGYGSIGLVGTGVAGNGNKVQAFTEVLI